MLGIGGNSWPIMENQMRKGIIYSGPAKKAKQHTASFLRPGKLTGNAGSGLEPNKDASLSRVAKRRSMFESAFKDISTRFPGEKRSVRLSIARDLSKRMFRGEEAVVRKDN
jgi:hypothetical protein